MQSGMQLELYYEWLGKARHHIGVSHATLARITQTTPNHYEALVKFECPLQC